MLRIGILGAADIAYNKFLPSLNTIEGAVCTGIASNSPQKLNRFVESFGLKVYGSYEELINSADVDCVYIPLPPAFHYKWAKQVLLAGKHVFLEKPFTMSYDEAEELVGLARERGLAIQENYMFQYHAQLKAVMDIMNSGQLGKIRLIRTSFGFPRRPGNDFRYVKELGGGTMMDNGGYTIKLITKLLGNNVRLLSSRLDYEGDIDIFGTADFVNEEGVLAQAAFGMDCQYQCSLEVWGSEGRLTTGRIYTAPAGLEVGAVIEDKNGRRELGLPSDDHFARSIEMYMRAVEDKELRENMAEELLIQARLVQAIIDNGGNTH